ncbi:MAG: FKBP-type peptidyl-prolyl cis-trans isomerase [Candidatus Latescibacteria bacterium]|nr:FKBP-type peptidyl-prolyl cis-trans isomerase [Candidatus Latescibacterota bacterium]
MFVERSLRFIISLLIVISFTALACGKGGDKGSVSGEIKSDTEKISYSLGTQFGTQLKQGNIKLDSGSFSDGLNQAINDKTLKYNEEEMTQVMESFQTEMQERMSAMEEPGDFKVDMSKVSYIIGSQIGENMRMNDLEISTGAFVRGLDDITNDKTPALTETEIADVMQKFQDDMRTKQEAEYKVAQEKNRVEASAFLAENAKKTGITTLPDSLQYEVITAGTGPKPAATDTVKVHYKGTLLDGTEFDSSYKHNQPAQFPLNGVIPGWTEVLQLMNTGAKWKAFIPPELAYGSRGIPPKIGPNSLLIFEIELLEIVK